MCLPWLHLYRNHVPKYSFTCAVLLGQQVEALEAEMAQELQRESEARRAAQDQGGEGAKAVQPGGPSLVLDEAAGQMGDGKGLRYSRSISFSLCHQPVPFIPYLSRPHLLQ